MMKKNYSCWVAVGISCIYLLLLGYLYGVKALRRETLHDLRSGDDEKLSTETQPVQPFEMFAYTPPADWTKYMVGDDFYISVPPTVELRKSDDLYTQRVRNTDWHGYKINISTPVFQQKDLAVMDSAAFQNIVGNVTVNAEKTLVTLPYTATDMTLAIDCDNELELIPGDMPITIESLGGTSPETTGKNVFRIQKEKWRPGVAGQEVKLRFHRKGLNQNYEEDCLTLVLSENPVKLEGLIQFNEGYEFDFERYIDNELGIITLPESKKLTVEYESGEGKWIKLEERTETPNSLRLADTYPRCYFIK